MSDSADTRDTPSGAYPRTTCTGRLGVFFYCL